MDQGSVKRIGWIASGVATLGLALAACGDGGGSEGREQNPPTPPAAGNQAADTPAAPPAPEDVSTKRGTSLDSYTGDAERGQTVFLQCRTCHTVEPGVNKTGPSLAGIVDRRAGNVAGYSYTAANANSDIIWSREKLFQYLESPHRVIPGTKMAFAGIPDEQKRADLIEFLASTE